MRIEVSASKIPLHTDFPNDLTTCSCSPAKATTNDHPLCAPLSGATVVEALELYQV